MKSSRVTKAFTALQCCKLPFLARLFEYNEASIKAEEKGCNVARDRKSKNALIRTMRSIGWSDDGARFMASHADDPRIARFIGKLERMPAPIQRIAQPGYAYLVGGNDVYKIGKSRDIPSRLRSFLQLPFKTCLIHAIPTSDMVWAENYLHRAFAHCRLNGEWFDLTPTEVAWICDLTSLNPDP